MSNLKTSQHILDLANEKKIAAKLEKVACNWKLEYLDIYDTWGAWAVSREFLAQLSRLSSLVDLETGKKLLSDSRRRRGGGHKWAILDARSAVSEAEALVETRDSKRVGDRTAHEQPQEPVICRSSSAELVERRSRQSVDSARATFESITPRRMDAPENAEAVPTAPQAIRESTPVSYGDAADTLARSTESIVLSPLRNARRQVTIPRATTTTPTHSPLTPISSTSADLTSLGASAARSLPLLWSSPHKRRRLGGRESRVGIDAADELIVDESHNLAVDQPTQRVLAEPVQRLPMDGDRVSRILEAFNPDPSVWYIASTHMVGEEAPTDDTSSAWEDVANSPKMLLFPLHITSVGHWTLVIYDRTTGTSFSFDAKGSKPAAEVSWSTVNSFLVRRGILQGQASVHLDPFPSMRQTDNIDCGIYVVVIALYTLHEKPVDRISAKLWRGLLAGFFPSQGESSHERITRHLGDFTKSTGSEIAMQGRDLGLECNMIDAETISKAKFDVQSYAKQSRLLLAMIETQLRKGELRQKLKKENVWCSAMPEDVDRFLREIINVRKEDITHQLAKLSEQLNLYSPQLKSLKESCSAIIKECDSTTLGLEKRRQILIGMVTTNYLGLGRQLAALYQ